MSSENTIINGFSVKEKAIAFTFDDGPNSQYTPEILDIFRKNQGKATFFMIGEQMVKSPEIVKAVHREGHEIGNHTWTHPYLTQLSKEDCLNEILQTEQLITDMIGQKPALLRPPYFDYNEQVADIAKGRNYKVIGAVNAAATDWELPGVEHIVTKTKEAATPGSHLLFHDGFGDRSQTVEAVRQLVTEFKEQGYRLVTVSELATL